MKRKGLDGAVDRVTVRKKMVEWMFASRFITYSLPTKTRSSRLRPTTLYKAPSLHLHPQCFLLQCPSVHPEIPRASEQRWHNKYCAHYTVTTTSATTTTAATFPLGQQEHCYFDCSLRLRNPQRFRPQGDVYTSTSTRRVLCSSSRTGVRSWRQRWASAKGRAEWCLWAWVSACAQRQD